MSSDIEHRVLQKGPLIVDMQLHNPSETIDFGSALNLGHELLRVTYEERNMSVLLATELNSEIQWSLSNSPGTLEGNTYVADETGTASLDVTYLNGASLISQTLTVTVEGCRFKRTRTKPRIFPPRVR